MSRNRNIKRRLLKRQLLRILNEGSGDTMAGRVSTLSEVSDRIDARLRYSLNQLNVSHMIYKGHKITFVDIPDDEMSNAIAEAKAMIDEEEMERNKRMSRQAILIAKRASERGCIAFRTEWSQHLAELVTQLGRETIDRGIEILTVSSTEVWGEYGPYSFIESEAKFIEKVRDMELITLSQK